MSYDEISKETGRNNHSISSMVYRICNRMKVPSKEMLIVDYYKKLLEKAEFKIVIKNWSVKTDDCGYNAPELNEYKLHGEVYNHPSLDDGETVNTSVLKSIDYKNKKAKTRNTEYYLEEPNPQWIEFLTREGKNIEEYLSQEVKFEI